MRLRICLLNLNLCILRIAYNNYISCIVNPFMPNELFYLNSLDMSISYIRGVRFLLLSCFVEISELNANSVDPDQPRSAASDLGLYCLPMSFLWDARLILVKSIEQCSILVLADILIYFSYLHQKIGFDISRKVSSKEAIYTLMQIFSCGNNLLEKPKPIFREK